MPLRRSRGNMYPWVTHTHAHLAGQCQHRCSYCYVEHSRFGRPPRYQGALRLMQEELGVRYGAGNTIFVEHCNDLFAASVPTHAIMMILNHCTQWPGNTYVLQTKNPARVWEYLPLMPDDVLLGCTIETNRDIPEAISVAPRPQNRAMHMRGLSRETRTFVTVEPIMDFDVPVLGQWLMEMAPEFVNVGADSKGRGLPEPSAEKVLAVLDVLKGAGVEVRNKRNLQRIVGNVAMEEGRAL